MTDSIAAIMDAASNAKAWPFAEARDLVKRLEAANHNGEVLFETGYGPSGLPHIGTFGEVVRTSMVRHAFEVVTGAKTEEDARNAARKYARIIQKLDFPARFTEFKIQNIVGSCDVKFPIRLEGLAYKHSHYSSYEPELFPGLIYRMVSPKIVLLIFVSGKVVLTGGKVRKEIYAAFEQIYPVLQEFRKTEQPAGDT